MRYWDIESERIVPVEEIREAWEADEKENGYGYTFGDFLRLCHPASNGCMVEIGTPARFRLVKDYGDGGFKFYERIAGSFAPFYVDGDREEVEAYFRDTFGNDTEVNW